MVVAIDGPAGAGKSTIAKKIAEQSRMFYLNSGNFYRAITFSVLQNRVDPLDEKKIIDEAKKCSLSLDNGRMHLNGVDIEEELHTDAVDRWVAEHSAIVDVRHVVNKKLREVSKDIDVVAEGRDITTVVFPDADLKVYLDATPEVRAKRRFDQGTSKLSYQEIVENIKKRDKIDKNKPFGSLTIAPDAFYLDTSDLTIDQVCDKVVDKIRDEKKLEWENRGQKK
jgi:cytidylate kinase